MLNITKMTARYLDHEDRIVLLSQQDNGGIVALWLIRPLTQRLVTTLIEQLRPEPVTEDRAEAVEAFRQAVAEEQHQGAPPVRSSNPAVQHAGAATAGESATMSDVSEGSEELAESEAPSAPVQGSIRTRLPQFNVEDSWLVREINVKVFDSGIALTFAGSDDEEQARCGFSEDLMRQWLGILRRVCLRAGWTSEEWPDWMKRESVMEQRGALPN